MSLTITNTTGDGLLWASIELPDSGTTVKVTGLVRHSMSEPGVSLTGSPVTIPAAPGSGSIFYILQANISTGAVTMLQSTEVIPSPEENNVLVMQQTLTSATTDPAINNAVTPDAG